MDSTLQKITSKSYANKIPKQIGTLPNFRKILGVWKNTRFTKHAHGFG